MTKVLQRVDTSLRSFYIFNSLYGTTEGEESKKILFYYPADIELDTKIKDVGLSEAIIQFSDSFSEDCDNGRCKAVHTQKTTQLFYEPEPGYWMVLVLNVPKEVRLKDGIEVTDYRGPEVNDKVYRAIVQQCYRMYRLFHGRLHAPGAKQLLPPAEYETLKQRLAAFFNKYIVSLRLPACDITDVTRSIQYLPLSKSLFLRSHNFVTMVCSTFPIISEAIFLYKDQIVCSGKMNPQDLFTLHEYIVSTGRAKGASGGGGAGPAAEAIAAPGPAPLLRSGSAALEPYRNGAFVTGAQGNELPEVFLLNGSTNELDSYYLIMYRALNATLCLFATTCSPQPPPEFYDELHSYMGPQLSSIAREIDESLQKQSLAMANGKTPTGGVPSSSSAAGDGGSKAEAMSPKYLFVNEQSLKHMSNFAMDKRLPRPAQAIPLNIVRVMADLYNERRDEGGAATGATATSAQFDEVQVKTTNDFWIIKRSCNWNQYFVIIFNSKATLLDVTLEAKRIFEQELTDDVFFDK